MRFLRISLLVALLTLNISLAQNVNRIEKGNLVIENIPEIPASLAERLDQYQNVRSAPFAGWANDGKGIFIQTRFGETSQVHFVSNPGGARTQLTFFKEPIAGISVRPTDKAKGFLYSKDLGGNELYQVYYYDQNDGSSKLMTDGKSRHGSFLWSNDGSKFAFTSNKRNGKDFDIYVADFNTPEKATMVFEGQGQWSILDFSPDMKQMLIGNYISINESSIYLLDIASKKHSKVIDYKEKTAMGYGKFSKDGKGIFFTSDSKDEFQKLQYIDLITKQVKAISNDINWSVEGFSLSKDGKHLAFTVNENGSSKLYLMDTKTFKYSVPKNLPKGEIGGIGFSPDSKYFGFTVNSSFSPGDAYTYSIAEQKSVRWTFSEVGGLNTSNFVEPELIEFPTFDKVDGKPRMIPAYYYKPKGKGPFPVVINFHGGPEGQFRPGFASQFQFMLNELGIAVIAPNVRGSDGYGKTFLDLDNGFLRENSVKDGGALLDWIAKQPELDAKKVCVYGGSYGGYMVLAMMTHYNDRIAAGIDVVGISNFLTFLKNTGDYRRDLRRVEYGDERDPEMYKFLDKISPLNNANKISKPLFVIQGLNDPRVPASEAEQIVAEVRKNGGNVWYLLAKDEGHGFRKKSNRDYYNAAIALFLQEVFDKK